MHDVYTYVRMYVCTTYVRTRYVCIYIYACMYILAYVCMYVRTYVCIYLCMYVCLCIYACMYVYIPLSITSLCFITWVTSCRGVPPLSSSVPDSRRFAPPLVPPGYWRTAPCEITSCLECRLYHPLCEKQSVL